MVVSNHGVEAVYRDRRPLTIATFLFLGVSLPFWIATSVSSPFWAAIGVAAGAIMAVIAYSRSSSTTWRVKNQRVEIASGDDLEEYSINEIERITAWELIRSPQDVLFQCRGGGAFTVPIHASSVLYAIGRQLSSQDAERMANISVRRLLGID